MTLLNIMLPNYFFTYSVVAYFLVSGIEGFILNKGLVNKYWNKKGFYLSALMNLISSILGLIYMINFPEIGGDNFLDNYLAACFLSIVFEYTLITVVHNAEISNKKLFSFLCIGNLITYTLIGILTPLILN